MESLIEGTVALLPDPPLSAQCQAGFSKTWLSGGSIDPSTLTGEPRWYLCPHSNPLTFLSFSASLCSHLGPDLDDILGHGPRITQGGSSIVELNVLRVGVERTKRKGGLEMEEREMRIKELWDKVVINVL